MIKPKISIKFNEEYKAGKTITTNSQFLEEFSTKDHIVNQRITIINLNAPGIMGFFYRNFRSKNIGNAFLDAYKKYLER